MDALRTPEDRFENLADFPFKPSYISDLAGYKGLRAAYVDEGAADADVELAGSGLTEAWVKRDNLQHLDWLDAKLRGNPVDGGRGDVAEVMLHNVEQGQCGRALALWIMRNPRVCLRLKRGSHGEGRIVFAAGCLVGRHVFCENGIGH